MKHTASTRSGFAARNDQMVSSMALWLVVVVAVRWWLRSLAGSVSGAEQVFIGSADPSRDGEKTNVVHGNFSRVTLSATPSTGGTATSVACRMTNQALGQRSQSLAVP